MNGPRQCGEIVKSIGVCESFEVTVRLRPPRTSLAATGRRIPKGSHPRQRHETWPSAGRAPKLFGQDGLSGGAAMQCTSLHHVGTGNAPSVQTVTSYVPSLSSSLQICTICSPFYVAMPPIPSLYITELSLSPPPSPHLLSLPFAPPHARVAADTPRSPKHPAWPPPDPAH